MCCRVHRLRFFFCCLWAEQSALSITHLTGDYYIYTTYGLAGGTPGFDRTAALGFPRDRVLYAGCMVKSAEDADIGNIADANVQAYPETIRKLQRAYPDAVYVIPGHQGWGSVQAIPHTLELLRKKGYR